MRPRFPVSRSLLALVFTLGLIAPIGLSAPPARAADTVVSAVNFNDGTTGTWTQSGSPTLTYVDDGAGGQALSVLRAHDYEGIQSPTSVLQHGIAYTFSMRARLPDGASGTTDVRFVVKPNYTWVGNTTIDATGWKTVTGTYTLPDDVDPATAQIYIGSTDQAAAYTFLIDDISITKPAPVDTVSSVNFDDSTIGAWSQSGSPTLGFVDDGSGGKALSVLRAHDYDGIQSPTGLLQHGIAYTFSMRARLPDGASGTTDVRFVVKPNYTWVGNTTIDATGWKTVTGTYTLPDDVDPATAQIYIGSTDQAAAYTILIDDISITKPASGGAGETVISTDFENGWDGWVARSDGTDPTLTLTTTESHSPTHAALISDRTSQGDGLGRDVTTLMKPGTTYVITAWVKFAAGSPADTLWLSMRRTNAGTDTYDTVGQFTSVPGDSWKQITATYTMGQADAAFMYFETTWPDGTTASFLVDDITVATQGGPSIEPGLTNLKDTVDFPIGTAIDSRETTGAYSQLLLKHFYQFTPENHMKPDAWYDANRNFRINPEAKTLMDYAKANGVRVYGHTLVWHQQTPDWFFQHDDGTALTNSDADKAILRSRLHDHIFNVAKTLSDLYGPFGSAGNPLVGFDVVNEVVSDGTTESDGLRRSAWYNVLGEEYIDDAFNWANQAFNVDYAAAGSARPIKLAINDYNTEQSGKRARMHDLVTRLLGRGVPVDIVGHQFHLSLSTPVATLGDALDAFKDLPVKQDVSELDVTVPTPVDNAKLIDQGYFYRDAFRILRAHASDLFSVTIWGLYDARSWRSANAPLLFDGQLKAKPAFFGAIDGKLPARMRSAFVFQGSVALGSGSTAALEWQQLPLQTFADGKVAFQARWEADHLTVFASVADTTVDASDAVTFKLGTATYTIKRDGTGTATGVVDALASGWRAVVHLPLTDAALNAQLSFDLSATDGTTTVAWNDPGAMGTLTLVEPLSYTEVTEAQAAPVIDGLADDAWIGAKSVTTGKQITGTDSASAVVRTLWKGSTLYVFAQVTDPVLDDTASDPWQEDSVEIYVDAGNFKNGPYRPDDMQLRINYKNVVSFGSGDEAAQRARVVSATRIVDGGYVVEAAIGLLNYGGLGTFHGLDFQVNDASGGARTGIRNWADPTNAGYQSTARWGVGRLVADTRTPTALAYSGSKNVVVASSGADKFGAILTTRGLPFSGQQLRFVLDRNPLTGEAGAFVLGTAVTDADGKAKLTVSTVGWKPGRYTLTVVFPGTAEYKGSSVAVTLSVMVAPPK